MEVLRSYAKALPKPAPMSIQSNHASTSVEQSNYRHLVLDIAWFAVALAATSRFLSIYAIHLGATAAQLGWISSLPPLIMLVTSSFGGWWQRRHSNAIESLFLPGLAFRFMFLLPAFAPLLSPELQPWWLVLAVALPAIPQGIAGVAFWNVMREAVTDNRMGPLLNQRSLAFSVTLAVGALVFGLWLEKAAFPFNYQIMFLLAFLFALGSLRHCLKIRVVAPAVQPAPVQQVNPWHAPAFRQVALVAAAMYIGFTSILAITPLHLVSSLKASEGFMAVFGLVELSAGAAVALLTPRLIDRFGLRGMIAIAMMGTAVAAVIFALAASLPITLLGAALSGACWTAAAMVGLNAYFSQNSPAAQMTPFSTAYQQVLGFSAFVGPLIGSSLASSSVSLVAVLMLGAALRVGAGLLIEHQLFFHWGFQRQRAAAKS
jgi:MFS family permease